MPPQEVQHGQDPKTQLLERLKAATNVLVTVRTNPSVDQLAAAIGLSLMLNKLGKHATAVFSGAIPSTIEFLQPEKTLEKTTDSLRDFIIALDKAKADKLRYKVEDKVVKIFITPYKSSLSEKDLEFSQGDFNVDVVVALGVHQQTDLDTAITAHGRILHDATVISVNNQSGGELGSIHWLDDKASSLSEMLASIADDLKPGILDEQMSTALLTGVVAETDRFRNERTTPQTMSVSGKLMTAGANQQLIAAKLDSPETIPQVVEAPAPAATPPAAPKDDGALPISHEEEKAAPPPPAVPPADPKPTEEKPADEPTGALDYSLHDPDAPSHGIHIDSDGHIHKAGDATEVPKPVEDEEEKNVRPPLVLEPPTMGGTLTASYKTDGGSTTADPLSLPPVNNQLLSHDAPPATELAPEVQAHDDETLLEIEETVHSPHLQPIQDAAYATVPPPIENARDAVKNAVAAAPPPLEPLQSLSSQPLGNDLHIPDMSATVTSDIPPASPAPLPSADIAPPPFPPPADVAPPPFPPLPQLDLPPPPPPVSTTDTWPSFVPPDNGPGPAPTDTSLPPSPPPPVPPPLPPMPPAGV